MRRYLKQEYRKSVKLLHAFNATGPLQALFYNNMGCLHYKLSKYTSAAFYFTRALQVSVAQKQKSASATYDSADKRILPAHNQVIIDDLLHHYSSPQFEHFMYWQISL